MTLLQAALLGILEGITEFLPISSTAHLILASRLFGIEETEFVKSFVITIQFGAILAVALLYIKRLFTDWKTNLRIIAAFLPTALIGFLLYKVIKQFFFEEEWLILATLFIGGVLLILFECLPKNENAISDLRSVPFKKAVLIGVAQAIAVVPGVSRSAATILGGELLGISRKAIVEFSFLLAVPTMFAATGYDLLQSAGAFSGGDLRVLALGFVVSGISAWASVVWLLNYIQKHSFTAFGVYRIILSLVLGAIFFFGG
jgi:undecaprenyl-diphosphatase